MFYQLTPRCCEILIIHSAEWRVIKHQWNCGLTSSVCLRSGVVFAPTWQQWFSQNGFLLGAIGVTGVFSVVVFILLCIHLYLASANTTTWEFMSRHRILYLKHCDSEENPFDRGVICNLWDFFCVCRTVAWERIYIRRTHTTVWLMFMRETCLTELNIDCVLLKLMWCVYGDILDVVNLQGTCTVSTWSIN